jgi:serine/threonine protein kinase
MSRTATFRDEPDPPGLPQIPGFEILSLIGTGGLRSVYRARRADGEVVALSITRPVGESTEDVCWRVAGLQARLSHPHVERLLGEGRHQGCRYLVTENLECGDLAARLRQGPLPPREAAELLAVVARAVHYLHQRGVLHRNLKPRNILFAADGSPRVGGFGLAIDKVERDSDFHQGTIVGTPSYMAPEQASGQTGLGPAADIHALGVILYECLAGRGPFPGGSVLDILTAVMHAPAPELPAAVPPGLRAICRRSLQKEPRERYPTAEALADDLERFLNPR